MADKRARKQDEDEGGYEPVGSPPADPGAPTEGSVDVRSTALGMGGPGRWESFRLTGAQRQAIEERPARVKALEAGNVVVGGMSPEDYLRWEIQQAVAKANDDEPCYDRATLERELAKRLQALDR